MATVFRVEAPSPIAGEASGGSNVASEYFKRLIQLIPAEVIGLYITLKNLIPPDEPFLEVLPAIALGLVFVVRIWGTQSPTGGWATAQWRSIGIAAVSFVIWIYAIGDSFFGLELPAPWYSGFAVGLWTFVVPYFYEGKT